MFYMKHNGKKLEIGADNVYTICPCCEREHTVDIQDILSCEHADLYSTDVYCDQCAAEREAERKQEKTLENIIQFPEGSN